MAAKLTFDLIGNATSAIEAFTKTTEASKKAAGGAESTGSTFKKVATAVATGYAVAKVVDFAKESVAAASEAAVANKQLTAAFRNAGDASGEFAKHGIELADSLGRQIGVSPAVIKGAEGVLATFHAVSSAAAVNSGVFDRATKAAADLAAAGFGDLTGNAKLLGKALSDPIKYMGALGRSGITLTKSQQDNIKAMVKQGNLLGAQKSLLGDVESRVGGMAAATATAGSKTGVAYEEMKAKLGTALLPAIKQAQVFMAGFFSFVSANSSWLIPLAAAIMGVVVALRIWMGVQAALNLIMDANPVVLIILAIVALVAAIVIVATKTRFFQDVWEGLMRFIQSAFAWIRKNWPLLVGILAGPIGIAAALIYKYWASISAAAAGLVGSIARFFAGVYATIVAPFVAAYGAVSAWLGRIGGYAGAVAGSVGRFFAGVYSAIVGPFAAALSWISGFPGAVGRALAGVYGAVAGAVSNVFNAIISPFRTALAWIQANILGPLRSAWNGFAHVINSVAISTPEVKVLGHTIVPAFHWTPPWHVPTLAQGGLLTRSGLVYAHAGEVISPAPAAAAGRGGQTINVRLDVNVPATANPAETGRAIASALRSFFAAGGRLAVPAP
jgi:hypothetical protein